MLGDRDRAISLYEKVVDPSLLKPMENNWAGCLCLRADYKAALSLANKALSLRSSSNDYDTRACASTGLGKFAEAWADFKQANDFKQTSAHRAIVQEHQDELSRLSGAQY